MNEKSIPGVLVSKKTDYTSRQKLREDMKGKEEMDETGCDVSPLNTKP